MRACLCHIAICDFCYVYAVLTICFTFFIVLIYSANLASLLVDRQSPPPAVLTVAEAAVFGQPICTIDGHNSDKHIADNFPSAIRRPQNSIDDMYEALHRGDCVFAAETVASWKSLQGIRKYNPFCDLKWVGDDRKVKDYAAGFATKADSGRFCTGLIRDVLNLHMEDIIQDGFLEDAWEREYRRDVTIDCTVYRPELELLADETNATADLVAATYDTTSAQFSGESTSSAAPFNAVPDSASQYADIGMEEPSESDLPLTRRRQLVRSRGPDVSKDTPQEEVQPQYPHQHHLYHHHSQHDHHRRQLKATKAAAGGAVAANGDGYESAEKLTVEQMIGTFAFHWFMSVIAITIGYINLFHDKYVKKHTVKALKSVGNTMQFDKIGESLKFGSKRRSKTPNTNAGQELNDIYESELSSDFKSTTVNHNLGRQTTVETAQLFEVSDSSGSTKELHEEMAALRRSQSQMEAFQREVLLEQRKMQEQLALLVGLQSSTTSSIRATSLMVSSNPDDAHH